MFKTIIKCMLILIFLMGLETFSFAYTKVYEESKFKNLLFYEGSSEELILTHEQTVGAGHTNRVMRIFVDKNSELKLILEFVLIDEHYYSGLYPHQHVAYVSDVHFDEMGIDGSKDILVTVKKIIFEDDRGQEIIDDTKLPWGGSTISKEEDIGTLRLKWNSEQYEYVLNGEMPPKLAEKYEYEAGVFESVKNDGVIIGDNIFW